MLWKSFFYKYVVYAKFWLGIVEKLVSGIFMGRFFNEKLVYKQMEENGSQPSSCHLKKKKTSLDNIGTFLYSI